MKDSIIIVLNLIKRKQSFDIEIPLDITANELVVALNKGFNLKINDSDIRQCYLKAENPIVLIKGNKTIQELQLRDGTEINFTR